MNITCIIHSLDGGGAERVMAGLASRLAGRGHAVTLVTLDDATGDRHHVDASVTRRPLDVMTESRGWIEKAVNTRGRIRSVRQAVKSTGSDVVLSFCDRTNILALQAAATLKVPVVVGERSDPSQQNLGRFWEYQRRRTYPSAARIVALTDTSAANLQPLSSRPVVVIPSAVDTPPSFSNRTVAAENRLIVGVGRLEPEKGFDRLIEAFAMAMSETSEAATQDADAVSPWTLRLLGEGTQRETLGQLAAAHAVDSRVDFRGWVKPVWEELAAATLFVLPSRYEGFPSALLEAMAVGVPSLAVDCESGPRAIITPDQDGMLVENQGPSDRHRNPTDDRERRDKRAVRRKRQIGHRPIRMGSDGRRLRASAVGLQPVNRGVLTELAFWRSNPKR